MNGELVDFNDGQLVSLIVSDRTDEACDELFRRYRKRIYLWCFSYTHDRDEAVEMTQEIFIKVFANLEKFRGGARLATWIYRITRNHCLNRLERDRSRWFRRLGEQDEEEMQDPACLESMRQAELVGNLGVILASAAGRMKPEELKAFVLHYREGRTVREVTRILDCPNLTGARTLIQNARRKFRRLIEEEGYSLD